MNRPSSIVRCAVYTRKSSEEGLEQSFNSLDAQREAGLDYIKSQKHQGWTAIPAQYDDGGFSGGTVERPGLQRLLDDIRNGGVDVVVVYKVDRLSRSLADFARLMQTFDEHKVSFVSVTQQFNTTTSMGRLTLNMLLSFAQFEREVTGERIRDKIAATKRQGVWVTGRPPLGYRVSKPGEPPGDRRLRIVESEAAIIRQVFATYLELHSLLDTAARMNDAGHGTRIWRSSRGIDHGGLRFNAAYVYRILTNPAYIGKITHKRGGDLQVFDGLHEPIIDRSVWDEVHSLMRTIERTVSVKWTHTHLLKGIVRTFEGFAMSPGSVSKQKPRKDGSISPKRVFYYCSQKALKQGYKNCPIKTINSGHLDELARAVVLDHLRTAHRIDLSSLDGPSRDHWIREAIHRVILAPAAITIEIEPAAIEASQAASQGQPSVAHAASRGTTPDEAGSGDGDGWSPPTAAAPSVIPKCLFTPSIEERRVDGRTALTLRIKLKRHDNRRVLVAPDGSDLFLSYTTAGDPVPQPHLVRALGQAFAWRDEIVRRGATIDSVARAAGITPGRVAYLLHLTRLSPAIIRAMLTGEVGPSTSVRELHAAADQLDWSLQATAIPIPKSCQ